MVVLNNAAGRASLKSNWVLNALGSGQLNAVFGRFADGDVHRFCGGTYFRASAWFCPRASRCTHAAYPFSLGFPSDGFRHVERTKQGRFLTAKKPKKTPGREKKNSASSTFSELVKLLTELVVLTTELVELIRLLN